MLLQFLILLDFRFGRSADFPERRLN